MPKETHLFTLPARTNPSGTVVLRKLLYGYLSVEHISNKITIRCAEVLIKAGANVAALNSLRETALHSACKKGSVDCAQLMIDHGLDVDALNLDFETPIQLMGHDSEKLRFVSLKRTMEHSKWKNLPRSFSLGGLEVRPQRSRTNFEEVELTQLRSVYVHSQRRQSEM